MATKAKRHVHKYHKVSVRYANLWACGEPLCSHHMPEHQSELVNGKASICWGCSQMFILNPANMKQNKPQCDECLLGLNKVESKDEISPEISETIINFVRS